jgi:hypothetical protein
MSLTTAIVALTSTQTTIASWTQIQNGDKSPEISSAGRPDRVRVFSAGRPDGGLTAMPDIHVRP